ncbi:MAG: hypothetical protein RLP44_00800 [Aggregatilineales bacterium]
MNTIIKFNRFNLDLTPQLTIIETILRERETFFAQIAEGKGTGKKIRAMMVSCFLFLALYGGVMGGIHSIPQALAGTIKLPILFLVTLMICTPSLHFFNVLFGSRQTIAQTLALILTAISTTSVLLFSLAPITFFFLLTSSDYLFFKLLNVLFFGIAGWLGVVFLREGMRVVTEHEDDENVKTRRLIFWLWVMVYAFVGSQMAWTLSPFMGVPDAPFVLIRHAGGNIYADILNSLQTLLGTF